MYCIKPGRKEVGDVDCAHKLMNGPKSSGSAGIDDGFWAAEQGN